MRRLLNAAGGNYVSCFIDTAGYCRIRHGGRNGSKRLSGLLVLAFIAELLFGFVFRMAKWLLWLPCVLGMAVLGILGAGLGVVPLTLMLVFGLVYGLVLLVGKCAVHLLRWLFGLFF